MRSNPIPNHYVISFDSDRTPTQANANGKDWKGRMNWFELKTRMLVILPPDAI